MYEWKLDEWILDELITGWVNAAWINTGWMEEIDEGTNGLMFIKKKTVYRLGIKLSVLV